MGLSWSKRHQQQHHPPLPPSSSPLITPSPTPPQPTATHHPPNLLHQTYAPSGPPPPLPPYSNFPNYYSTPVHNTMGQYPNYHPYYIPQITGWGPSVHPPPPLPPPPQHVVPYVDHQSAKKIKNNVNVHKDTIRLLLDDHGSHLVSFTFDALVDGSITIFYFAKEGDNCKFTPVYPEIVPVKVPFQKGLGQKICQPSGTGVDLGFFDIDDLEKPIPGEDVYPLVLSAESCGPMNEHSNEELVNTSRHAQISQAVIEKKDGVSFQVKVIKQILWIDGVRYELREIFGMSDSDEAATAAAFNDIESGKECVICITEVKNTAVLPCRHMCMCSECAKELRLQSNKCPVCRQPIQELLEIKLDDHQCNNN